MRILVVGPGALGTLFAVRLHQAGHEVLLGCRSRARAAEHGRLVAIDTDGQEHAAEIPAVHRARDAVDVDVLILATKIDAAGAALQAWLPALGPDGVVVSLLNGLRGDALARIVPDRLLACTVAFPATLEATGRSRQTGPGHLIVGPWPDLRMAGVPDAAPVAEALAAVAPTTVHHNMQGVQWTKLLINAASTTLGALTGHDFGALLQDARARTAFLRILTEGYEVGLAEGVRFERVLGIQPHLLALPPAGSRLPLRRAVLAVMRRRYRAYRSSSLQSRLRGQRSEARYLNGEIVATGARHGIATPVNEALLSIMDAIDDGRAEPSSGHLDRLLRA